MDTKTLFQEIRKIIREEITLALSKKDISKKTTDSFKEEIQHGLKLQSEITTTANKKTTIQDLLNETRTSMVAEDKTLNFTSADAQNFRGSMAEALGYGGKSTPSVDINGSPVNQLDPVVEKALTRNYSDVMKAIKEKNKKT